MTDARTAAPERLPDALQALRDRVAAVDLGLATPERDAAARDARAVVDQVDDYLLPRLRDLDAPLLAVVGGSTGAGKSTLVNSLRRRARSPRPACCARPPARRCWPARPSDLPWFADDRVLPGLARTTGAAPPGTGRQRAAPRAARRPAGRPRPARRPRRRLRRRGQPRPRRPAARRRRPLGLRHDRRPLRRRRAVGPAAHRAGARHRAGRRARPGAARGGRARSPTTSPGMLDRARLTVARGCSSSRSARCVDGLPARGPGRPAAQLAAPAGRRPGGSARPSYGRPWPARSTASTARVAGLAAAVEQQAAAADALRAAADAAYDGARAGVDEGVRSGTLLRGEVLARWQEFVGTGEWMRSLQAQVGRLRDRLTAGLTGRTTPAEELQVALESSVEQLLRGRGRPRRRAHRHGLARAARRPGAARRPRRASSSACRRGFAAAAADEVRDWQGVRARPRPQRGRRQALDARAFLSFGVNGAGLVVMVAVFAHTGGLTGGEVAVAGGTSALGQRLLEAVFGDAAVRTLAAKAREDLGERADRLLAAERARFDALVAAAAPADGRRRRGCATRLRELRRRARRDAGRAREPPRAAAGRPAGARCARRSRSPRAGSRCPRSARRARCSPRPARARRSATRPSSRSPARPAAASRRCSTRSSAPRSRRPGVRRPTTGVAHAAVWARPTTGRPAARLARGAAPPRRRRPRPGARRPRAARPARPRLHRAGAPARGRPAGAARRRAGVGARPAEVRRRRRARPLPRAVRRPRRRAARRPQPGRPARRTRRERACLADLRRLLDSEGLAAHAAARRPPAASGTGLHAAARRARRPGRRPPRRHRPAHRRRPHRRRPAGARTAAARRPARPARRSGAQLVAALGDAAGVPAVVGAVERSTRRRGRAADRLAAGALDPQAAPRPAAPAAPVRRRRRALAHRRCPPRRRCSRRGSATALREARDAAGERPAAGLARRPAPHASRRESERLPDRLDRAVAGTDLGPERDPALAARGRRPAVAARRSPRWSGALWLLALVGLGYLQLDDVVPLPRVEGVPAADAAAGRRAARRAAARAARPAARPRLRAPPRPAGPRRGSTARRAGRPRRAARPDRRAARGVRPASARAVERASR